jgi:hypothetical protein
MKFKLFDYGVSKDSLELYNTSKRHLEEIVQKLNEVKDALTEGGVITFEQLWNYLIVDPENPVKYEFGKNCYGYVLEKPNKDTIVFLSLFEPTSKEKAEYGRHMHPNCEETCIQIEGTAICNGKKVLQYEKIVFPPGFWHNYVAEEKGAAIVTFRRVK